MLKSSEFIVNPIEISGHNCFNYRWIINVYLNFWCAMKLILSLIFLVLSLFSNLALCDESIPKPTLKFGLQLVKINEENFLALNYDNHPKWHTYWTNPGDAGLPIKNHFSINQKDISFEDLPWPTPSRFIEPGDMWAYGYENSYTLFYKIPKKDFTNFSGKTIHLKSSWLICKHICVPGSIEVDFKLTPEKIEILKGESITNLEKGVLVERFNNLPTLAQVPDYLEINLHKGAEDLTLVLDYKIKGSENLAYFEKSNLIYPFPLAPFDFKHESLSKGESGSLHAQMPILWDGEYQEVPIDFPKDGKFKKPYTLKFLLVDPITQKSSLIEKTFTEFQQTTPAIINISPATPVSDVANTPTNVVSTQSTNSFIYYLVLAFLGGLILNIMPCVLPVISIKLFGLIKYQNQSHSQILKHNLFYTLGILTTFAVLASIVLSLKTLGTQVGWGFQLQSPLFISIMIIGLFIFSLNLFGLFEFKTPGGNKLGNVQLKSNFTGDFLSGVLATVLSTPCSAPFLGTALTFAFSAPAIEIYLTFMAIGLGLASPFIVTALYPKLVAFLPRPGNWMNTVKKVLGVTLLLTILWLFDVYNTLVDGSNQLVILGGCLVFIFAGFAVGKKKIGIIRYASFLLALAFFGYGTSKYNAMETQNTPSTALLKEKQAKGLDWQAWSEEAMQELKTNRELVFIDFTAKWCFTCKVNEKLVLETSEFKELVKENNMKLLLADWTKRDEIIGSFLRKNNLVGVPAYFIQKPDGTLINLGETITINRIKEHL